METNEVNGWNQWSKHVLLELERFNKCLDEVRSEIVKLKIEVAKLKVKAGVWGLIGGSIPVVIGLGLYLIKIYMGS